MENTKESKPSKKIYNEMGIRIEDYVEKLILEDISTEEFERRYEDIKEKYGEKYGEIFLIEKTKLINKKKNEESFQNKCKLYKKRKEVEKLLNEVPEGEKIKLDKSLLEELIFTRVKVEYDDDYAIAEYTAKYPIWTGNFLRRVDLSEVDFSFVDWSGRRFPWSYKCIYDYDIEKNEPKKSKYEIDLSETNAQIDFSSAFQTLITPYNRRTNICSCNLSGIDLSNSNYQHINSIVDSDLSNTNIKIGFYEFEVPDLNPMERVSERYILGYSHIENSNLDGNDLGDVEISAYVVHGWIENSSFRNTGLKITTNSEAEASLGEFMYKEVFPKGCFDNCYIGDKKIDSKEIELETMEKSNRTIK